MECPIFRGDFPDPSILRHKDRFYITHSSFQYSPGLLIWESSDLVNWSPICVALADYDGDVWAPELIEYQGIFYIYYKTTGGNHVTTAPQIEGPWSPPHDLNLPYIDPGHVVGSDGQRYIHLSKGQMVELSADGLQALTQPREVYQGWTIPEDWRVEGPCLEGPKFVFRDTHYHMLTAMGGTAGPATSHMVISARSTSPVGPWENSPYNPIVHTENRSERWWSKGHGTLIEDLKHQWWIVYHAYENGYYTLGRQSLISPIRWTEEGWPVLDKKNARELPSIQDSEWNSSWEDHFDQDTLSFHWSFFGNNQNQHYSLKDKSLILEGSGTSIANSSLLTCHTRHHAYLVEVDIELLNEQAEAGLLLFYSSAGYTGLALNRKGLAYVLHPGGATPPVGISGNRGRMRLLNDRHEVELYWKPQSGDWQRLPKTLEVSGMHHNVHGNFLSLRPTLFCSGQGSVRFSRFSYTPLTKD
ncbi:MAG: family 43 glycosylhydrolase [Verrucomicrobiota bacterium]